MGSAVVTRFMDLGALERLRADSPHARAWRAILSPRLACPAAENDVRTPSMTAERVLEALR